MIKKKLLLLGYSGKMGSALLPVLERDYTVHAENSHSLDCTDEDAVCRVVETLRPSVIVNTVAMLGIDACEKEPQQAFILNTMLPKTLASCAGRFDAELVHFSTDAVFGNADGKFWSEADCPEPLNLYGMTKLAGDHAVIAGCSRHKIIRISVLFGPSRRADQFVEKMLGLLESGHRALRIADDIRMSPTYAPDVAERVGRLLRDHAGSGLYHVCNQGVASLYEFMAAIVASMGIDAEVHSASYKDFPFIGKKNLDTPMTSVRGTLLRPWKEAVADYCRLLTESGKNNE